MTHHQQPAYERQGHTPTILTPSVLQLKLSSHGTICIPMLVIVRVLSGGQASTLFELLIFIWVAFSLVLSPLLLCKIERGIGINDIWLHSSLLHSFPSLLLHVSQCVHGCVPADCTRTVSHSNSPELQWEQSVLKMPCEPSLIKRDETSMVWTVEPEERDSWVQILIRLILRLWDKHCWSLLLNICSD